MVTPFSLLLHWYVVISGLVGCTTRAFQLFTYVPRNAGSFLLVEADTWEFMELSVLNISIIGEGLDDAMTVFVAEEASCESRNPLDISYASDDKSQLHVNGNLSGYQQDLYYICFINNESLPKSQQQVDTLVFQMKKAGFDIPKYIRIICSVFLLCLSGLFSGLNLGLMSLDLTSLRILIETGDPTEKRYAFL